MSASRPVVLVTGAARRIGRCIALDLASHGYDVGIHFLNSAAEAEATAAEVRRAGVRAHTLRADLASESDALALVPRAVEAFGRLDAVVNSASIFEADDAASVTATSMERHWRANTAPAVLLTQALHAHIVAGDAQRQGCVVNLVDQKLWNPNPDFFSYTLSKAALQAATVMLAQACAPRLRVCGVAPGVTLTSGAMDEAEFQRAFRMTPLQRASTPDDVARSVRFLLESPAITGTTLLVDGGQHLSAQPRDVFYLARTP